MKICFVSYEYEPFPGGGIATYHNAAAKALAAQGHEVHVVTNRAFHGRSEPHLTQRLWKEGNLTIHRLRYFDEKRQVPPDAQFIDVNTSRYSGKDQLWARDPSNLAAHQAAGYIEALHADVGLDVIEAPEFFAEAFYVQRRRASGDRWAFPPVCIHGHISSRIAFGVNHHVWELGWEPHRHMMRREEYCIQHADALITPSRSLMARYENLFGEALPEIRATIPYYLDLPEDIGTLPQGLDASSPYMALIGRVEPRKGPDLAMQAFAQIADDYPELRLVLMGKEMWHQGESVDDVIATLVPERHRGRIVRLGQVRRERALAAARQAVAFLHPAPWDNYPCAVLEAMAAGATCLVSDSGGQAEMVVDGDSGLVFPAGDGDGLAAAMRRVLDDRALKEKLATNAVTRLREITEPEMLTRAKLDVFEKMVAREQTVPSDALGAFRPPAFIQQHSELPALAGGGVVVLDAVGAEPGLVASSQESLQQEVHSSGSAWQLITLVDPSETVDVPPPWTRRTTMESPVWRDLAADQVVVYVAAGVRFDVGMMRGVVAQVVDSSIPCGSFAWLRPASSRVFPYASDLSVHDLLIAGSVLPPVFAVHAAHLAACRGFGGLHQTDHRLGALMAAAAASGDLLFQHTGQVCGDYYGDLPMITRDLQRRTVGFLEVVGRMPAGATGCGAVEVPVSSTPEYEAQLSQQTKRSDGDKKSDDVQSGGGKAQLVTRSLEPAAVVSHDNGRYEELEEVYRQHTALKQMRVVRWLRKAGAFSVARRMFPKAKKMIGPG